MFGTRAHVETEALSKPLAQALPPKGPGVGLAREQFRDKSGNIVGRRAPQSLGLDAVIYDRGSPSLALT